MKPSAFAAWIENPCPVAENWVVIPPTIKLSGSGECGEALSKSKRTLCAEAGPAIKAALGDKLP